jgi:DGQHR domain-containing protein
MARQSPRHKVFVFKARASDVLRIAQIDRAGRTKDGAVKGFQRPQIASHIARIKDYLSRSDAVLPNAITVAFLSGVRLETDRTGGVAQLVVDISRGAPGYVVDGQQRLTALTQSGRNDFEVFVIGLHCLDFNELRKQFILVNSTRPLPKSLIYELLPHVDGMPADLHSRAFAAGLTDKLNFDVRSSLQGTIKTHTNPTGIIRDTALHKVIITSAADGAIRELMANGNVANHAFDLLSNFYGAVQDVFPEAWHEQTPKTSRLVHGTGIMALGYVMEQLYTRRRSADRLAFRRGLQPLRGRTAWTSGTWRFGKDEVVPWNRLQNVPRDVSNLAHYLIDQLRPSSARRKGRRHYA